MIFSMCNIRDLQNLQAILSSADVADKNITEISAAIADELSGRVRDLPVTPPVPSSGRRPDNVITCQVCGKQAVVVPLSGHDRAETATHAIQCQNRPATDQPWLSGHCGHTEYIVRGDR